MALAAVARIITAIVLACTGSPEEIDLSLPGGVNITAFKGDWSDWTERIRVYFSSFKIFQEKISVFKFLGILALNP